MAMEIVNGYPCRDCSDVEKAKKGIDPNARPGGGRSRCRIPEGNGLLEERTETGAASTGRFPLEISGRR